jgi:hypothetical protein
MRTFVSGFILCMLLMVQCGLYAQPTQGSGTISGTIYFKPNSTDSRYSVLGVLSPSAGLQDEGGVYCGNP